MRLDNLEVWHDYDGEALRLGECMRLDSVAPATDADLLAKNVFDIGGRLVVFDEIIDFDALDMLDSARFFMLLRELTSYAIKVDWRLKISHDAMRWRDLWHLFPPSEVVISADKSGQTLEFWKRHFYFGLCVMRRGPGMIEVRDRRSARLRSVRFTSPSHLEAIERLERGAPASSFAPEVLTELEAARVVMAIGDMRLWLPYRFRRAPLSSARFW